MIEIITSKQDYKKWIEVERERLSEPKGIIHIIRYFGNVEYAIIFHYMKILRKTELYFNTKKKVRYKLYRAKLNRISNMYCIHIPPNTCGMGLKIMHLGPILINNKAHIGKDASIHIGTSIVAKGSSDDAPYIGDHCVIGVNSTVLGGVILGNDVAIGANSLVNRSFSESSITIAGIPAKKICDYGPSSWQ